MEFGGFFQINYLFLALGLEGPCLILSGMAAEKLMGSETESVIKLSSSREIKVPLYFGKVSLELNLGVTLFENYLTNWNLYRKTVGVVRWLKSVFYKEW